MSNPEVTRLIQELSGILEQNRQKRNVMDSMLQGLKQGREMAQAKKPQPAGGPESSYGNDRGASPFSYKNSPTPSAKSLSPSTSREGRLGIASKYAETQGRESELLSKNPYNKPSAREAELLNSNPYDRDAGVAEIFADKNYGPGPGKRETELLNSNPYQGLEPVRAPETTNLTNDAIAQEMSKRIAQRTGQGSPLGGAGMPPPTSNGLDPSVVDAVSRSGGPVAPMGNPMVNTGGPQQPGPAAAMPNAPPAGWSADDYNLLTALSQRYQGG